MQLQPIAPLDGITNRHRGSGVTNLEIARVQLRHALQLLNDLRRLLLAPALQIGVHQVVHRMQLFSRVTLLVRRSRAARFEAIESSHKPEPREDMRRHVQRMRR